MKKVFLALLIVISVIMQTSTYASNTATALISGSVSAVNEITVSNINTSIPISSSGSLVSAFDIVGSNNSSNGFKLTFSSNNSGQLRSSQYDVNKHGTFLDYTVDIVESILPSTSRTNTTLSNIDLGNGDCVVSYNQSVDSATKEAKWTVKISYPAKDLFSSTYSDSITVVISDI